MSASYRGFVSFVFDWIDQIGTNKIGDIQGGFIKVVVSQTSNLYPGVKSLWGL